MKWNIHIMHFFFYNPFHLKDINVFSVAQNH